MLALWMLHPSDCDCDCDCELVVWCAGVQAVASICWAFSALSHDHSEMMDALAGTALALLSDPGQGYYLGLRVKVVRFCSP